VKDSGLIEEALRSAGVSARIMTAVRETLEAAADRVGDPDAVDSAAVFEGFTAQPR
jgi:3-hydroxyisobutyrate dehydrogenase